jgi:hypothetical protein
MNGTLFFDGACGMCTRSRDFLLKLDRTGNVQTEPLQSPSGHHADEPAGIGPVAGFLGHRLFRRAGRQRGTLRGNRQPNSVGDLPDSRYPLHRGRRLSLGGRAPVPVPWHDTVLRVTSGRVLSSRRPPPRRTGHKA